MALVNLNIKIEENLKKQLEILCKDFGMNLSVAFNIFAKAVVREKKIPFEISSKLSLKSDSSPLPENLPETGKIILSKEDFLNFLNDCTSQEKWEVSEKYLALAKEVSKIEEIKND